MLLNELKILTSCVEDLLKIIIHLQERIAELEGDNDDTPQLKTHAESA